MSQNAMQERTMTLGQTLVNLSDVLTNERGEPLDLDANSVKFRLVTAPEDETEERVVLVDDLDAVIDDEETGLVSYVWTTDDVDAIREAFGETAASMSCWYWWVREKDDKIDRHPGDGDRAKITFVRDW